jgi:hypothetical protein
MILKAKILFIIYLSALGAFVLKGFYDYKQSPGPKINIARLTDETGSYDYDLTEFVATKLEMIQSSDFILEMVQSVSDPSSAAELAFCEYLSMLTGFSTDEVVMVWKLCLLLGIKFEIS